MDYEQIARALDALLDPIALDDDFVKRDKTDK